MFLRSVAGALRMFASGIERYYIADFDVIQQRHIPERDRKKLERIIRELRRIAETMISVTEAWEK